MDRIELQALAIELSAAMPREPESLELILATGEALPEKAMELARLYARANFTQRAAFDALSRCIAEQPDALR